MLASFMILVFSCPNLTAGTLRDLLITLLLYEMVKQQTVM